MKINNLTFDQWAKNHRSDHKDKWYRELYPFHVFRLVDFDNDMLGKEQEIDFNRTSYYATIKKIELQENGRYRTTFNIATSPRSKTQRWKNRQWNTTFQIVYEQDFSFITIYTKKNDPSEDFVEDFMKGSFTKIIENKSIPISELLLRTLILHVSEENFIGGTHHTLFDHLVEGVREIEEHPQFKRKRLQFSPIYSIDRELWICYSFTEEKAHRLAFYNANQCHQLIVVFCNPTYTRHHRCTYPGTKVVSLYELSELVSSQVRKKYERQIRFLQNHLNQEEELNSTSLLAEIQNPLDNSYEILKSNLMEALSIMKIRPRTEEDLFHSLCAFNLINAYLSNRSKNKTLITKGDKLFRNMYYFKTYITETLAEWIKNAVLDIPIYLTNDLVIIEINGFQFSFRNIPLNSTLAEYLICSENEEIIWRGKKLQPIAPLLFNYSRALRAGK